MFPGDMQQIDVMLGSDNPVFQYVLEEIRGSQPSGWVCFGPTLVNEFRRNSRSHFTRTYRTCHIDPQPPPDDILRKFWELEALGIKETSEKQAMTAGRKSSNCNCSWIPKV
jgi:hypothetical protein